MAKLAFLGLGLVGMPMAQARVADLDHAAVVTTIRAAESGLRSTHR
jgi:3-hydroxyisobutyrate dehydrogenase-like beta-hydroxyacid dehydrogenase